MREESDMFEYAVDLKSDFARDIREWVLLNIDRSR
jgi:hypothetical protein